MPAVNFGRQQTYPQQGVPEPACWTTDGAGQLAAGSSRLGEGLPEIISGDRTLPADRANV